MVGQVSTGRQGSLLHCIPRARTEMVKDREASMLQAVESDTTERLNGSRTAPGWAVHTGFLGE